jgi:hypothetical protein
VLRWLFIPLLLSTQALPAQVDAEAPSAAPLTISRAISVPLNATRLFDAATTAWTWTFGKEPGAKVLRSDRETGVIEGVARMNYRSTLLSLREETMGIVQYRVRVELKAGECRVVVNELVHTGNRSTARGGMHLGQLTQGELPAQRVRGTSRANVARIHAEIKGQVQAHVGAVIQSFHSRIRALAEE